MSKVTQLRVVKLGWKHKYWDDPPFPAHPQPIQQMEVPHPEQLGPVNLTGVTRA